MSQLPSDVCESYESYAESIDKLSQSLGHIIGSKTVYNQSAESLKPLEQSRLHLTVAFAVSSVVFSMMRARGVDPKESPIYEEIQRVKDAVRRLKEAEDAAAASKELEADSKPQGAETGNHSFNGASPRQQPPSQPSPKTPSTSNSTSSVSKQTSHRSEKKRSSGGSGKHERHSKQHKKHR
jgi:hypothetical protein